MLLFFVRNEQGGMCIRMDKPIRMQKKIMFTLAGILLLLIFSVIGSDRKYPDRDSGQKKEEMKKYEYAYLKEISKERLILFCEKEVLIPLNEEDEDIYLQMENGLLKEGDIVTIVIQNGRISSLCKEGEERVSRKVLSAEKNSYVELEGKGKIPVSEEAVIYNICNGVQYGDWQDIAIGSSNTDFVVKGGKICAALVVQNRPMENIRVLLKSNKFQNICHETLKGYADCGFTILYGREECPYEDSIPAGQEFEIAVDSAYFSECDRIFLIPEAIDGRFFLKSIERSQGTPVYRGNFEVVKTKEGLVIINELPIEEYLYAVVPSEMPASYPIEALKAQAVCARTYAYVNLKTPGYEEYGAHVDDSTGYQVYGNIYEREETTRAVQETCGHVLCEEGELVNTFYYSTSCGYGSDDRVWNPQDEKKLIYLQASSISEAALHGEPVPFSASDLKKEENFHAFLQNPFSSDFEKEEPWYRWSTHISIDSEKMLSLLQERYRVNPERILTLQNGEFVSQPVKELGEITGLSIVQRGEGGIAESMVIRGRKNTYQVLSEYNIRVVLCMGGCSVLRQDGSSVERKKLLPMALFAIETTKGGENVVGCNVYGGGYGHGAGMSQNAAKDMAEKGYTAQEILGFFYKNCKIEEVEGLLK